MNKSKLFISLLVYLLGTIFLLCSDFYVSKNFEKSAVADWAALKSIIFVCGGICVFGFDQILMRRPELVTNVIKSYLFQVIIFSLIISFFITNFFIENLDFGFVALIIGLYAINQFWAATFRGDAKLIEAQVFTNGWKIFALLLLIIGINNFNYIYSISFLIVLLLNSYFIFKFLKKYKNVSNANESESLYKLGSFFLINNLSVTIATYGEQLLVNSFGDEALSYNIFTYTLAFNSAMLLFAGFLGFYFGPKFKSIKNMSLDLYSKYLIKFILFSIFLSLLSFILGVLIFKFYLHESFNVLLAITCLIVGFVKIVYTIPSVCVALYCKTNDVKRISIFNLYNLAFFILGIVAVLHFSKNYLAFYIFIIIALHWVVRFINTHLHVKHALREKNANT
ncbi:hypothetical protein ACKER9_12620 [Acinetobacter baumannii]|uniref:hypothetical protein n=1 Tax=Acinetobacter baumannii TaxID=470 RepID=UPI0038B6A0F5